MNLNSVDDIDPKVLAEHLPKSVESFYAFTRSARFVESRDPGIVASVRLTKDGIVMHWNMSAVRKVVKNYHHLAFIIFHEYLHILSGHQLIRRMRTMFGLYELPDVNLPEEATDISPEIVEKIKLIKYVQELEIKHLENMLMPDDVYHDINRQLYEKSNDAWYRLYYRNSKEFDTPLQAYLHRQVFSDGRYSLREAYHLLKRSQEWNEQQEGEEGSGSGQGEGDGKKSRSSKSSGKPDGRSKGNPEGESEDPSKGQSEGQSEDQSEDESKSKPKEEASEEEAGGGNEDNEGDQDKESDRSAGGEDKGDKEDGGEGDGESEDKDEDYSDIAEALTDSKSGIDDDANQEDIDKMFQAASEAIKESRGASKNSAPDDTIIETAAKERAHVRRDAKVDKKFKRAQLKPNAFSLIQNRVAREMGHAIRYSSRPNFKDHRAQLDWITGKHRRRYSHKTAPNRGKVELYYDISGSQDIYIPACNEIILQNKNHLGDQIHFFGDVVKSISKQEFFRRAEEGSVQDVLPQHYRGTAFKSVISHIQKNKYQRVIIITDNEDYVVSQEQMNKVMIPGWWFLLVLTQKTSARRGFQYGITDTITLDI